LSMEDALDEHDRHVPGVTWSATTSMETSGGDPASVPWVPEMVLGLLIRGLGVQGLGLRVWG
jgi:hypothetical protein